jgi:CHAD domain-containing protein
MKQKEIAETVEGTFKKINKLLHKIIKEFNAGDIHDFREQVKRLRAFLRMVYMDDKDEKPVLPGPLKTFYGYIGIIRNIKLQKHRLFEYIEKYNAGKPHQYTDILDKEKNYWQQQANTLMETGNFDEAKKEVVKQLPQKVDKAQIKTFVERKLKTLATRVNHFKDEAEIHPVWKILRNILYIWHYIPDKSLLPEVISREEDLKSITDVLENFMDISAALAFMRPEYIDKIRDENERKILYEFQNSLLYEKAQLWDEILHTFNVLYDQLYHMEII